MILLIASTDFNRLLKAFQRLRCPGLFIMLLSFMYRYIFVITDELMKMNQARDSRSAGILRYPPCSAGYLFKAGHWKAGVCNWLWLKSSPAAGRWFQVKVLANMLGVLFVRAYERGENVYLAMCSRGFRGKIITLHKAHLKIKDLCFLVVSVGILTGIRLLGL
jgi:cobalt/nickel transport system permease protein